MSLVLTPEGTPASPVEGELYYDSTADKVKVRDASGYREVVSEDSSGAIRADVINEKTSANGVSIKSGSNIGITIDSNGYTKKPNLPFFCGRGRSGNVLLSSPWEAILFTGNITNNGITQNTSTGKCSIPTSGRYYISLTNGNVTSANNNQYLGLGIFKNTTFESLGWSLNTGYDRTAHCEVILDLSTSDTIAFCYEGQYAAPPTQTHYTTAIISLIG